MPYTIEASDRNIERLKDKNLVIEQLNREIQDSELILSDWKNRILKYYELYGLVQRHKNYQGMANIFVPETLRAVETIVAKIYQMIFGQPDWFQYEGRDNNGDEGSAIAMTQLVRYQMEENHFKARIMDTLRQMVIAGLCVRKVTWDYEEVRRRKRNFKEGKSEVEEYNETIKDTWVLEPVDLLSFHISDINIPYNDIQKAAWIAEQFIVDKNWVSERTRRGWFSAKMREQLESDDEKPKESRASQMQDQRMQTAGFNRNDLQKKGKVEIIERWGLVPVEWVLSSEEMKMLNYSEGEQIEGIVVLGNRTSILKLEVNMFWHGQKPYVACPYVPKEFELPGIGVPQIGEKLQEEINDTRNQAMDNKTLVLANMWLKERSSGIKNQDLVMRQNGIINTNNINGLLPLRPPLVAPMGSAMEGAAKEDLRQSVGAASNLQGIAQAGIGTATESAIVNRESMGRLLMTAQLFVELVIKPVLIFAVHLNHQFYDHVKMIKIVGPAGAKWSRLEPKKLAGGRKDVSVKISLDSSENPAVLRQQFQGFITLLFQMPPQLIEFHYKALDRLYGMYFNGHRLNELYPNPAPDEKDLLTPEEERNMILASQPVLAQKGQDHQTHIKYHEQELESMKYGLDDLQFELYKKLILSHYSLMQSQLQEMQMQFMAQQMMGIGGGPETHNGQAQNTTPYNQTQAPSIQSLRKEIGL